jgi:hypothetical protein
MQSYKNVLVGRGWVYLKKVKKQLYCMIMG